MIRHDVTPDERDELAEDLFTAGHRLALVGAHDDGADLRVVYLFLAPLEQPTEISVRVPKSDPRLQSLSYLSFPAARFEREMMDLFGITPTGHPRPRRLVKHAHWPSEWYPMRRDAGPPPDFDHAARFPFVTVEGDGVYEIPVGPVHAGMIEPGHFRFSVVGETVLRLKARLWFVHRGIEKLFEGRGAGNAVDLAERVSGDTSAGHACAHSLAVESASGITMPDSAQQLRSLLLELERLYNHAGDLGALANDVGFSLAHAHAQRIRERLLRINDRVTGHRLLRGATRPGAVRLLALPDPRELAEIGKDLAEVTDLTLGNSIIYDRFLGTSILTEEQATELGCLGVVARASGVRTDARVDHPITSLPVTECGATSGDVLARYTVRRDEFAASIQLATQIVDGFTGSLEYSSSLPQSIRSGVGIVEGWRGTIVHRVEVEGGRLTRSRIVDPSWFNWPAVPVAMADTIVPDFPLTNKSFNLSYAGNDL